ncbi:MBL fold metallo-hydrolase [Fodinicurvata sp. EGI_FJ10296]|uniref:MBL fold metallo-hydrolase n=1 Tax=Fodinicurvata sp. EGI_FJ10296 TaxID=3231908 RepID=UPI003453AC3D
MTVELGFYGAAGTVTGSCFRLATPAGAFLIDCGMFQGTKTVKELNYQGFPFDPAALEFVLLTHAHIDHAGLLPKLVAAGFKGPIYATTATCDLLQFVLPDSANVQASEVERLNRRRRQRGQEPVTPIYSAEDADHTLDRLRPVDYDAWIEPGAGVSARFWNAGHMLGSASVELAVEEAGTTGGDRTRLLFSGDIGPGHKLFHPDPAAPSGIDHLICESTYGARDRVRLDVAERREVLRDEVQTAIDRGGNLLIPAFAVERTQEILVDLAALFVSGALKSIPVFLDSPLAARATAVFAKHAHELENMPRGVDPFTLRNLKITETVEQSKAIGRIRGGAIIMAGSGMCDAGRIRHHLKAHLWRSDCTVLLTGFQAVGTMGRLLQEGRKVVRIHGEETAVAARIRTLDGYSGHADSAELIDWVTGRLPVGGTIFLVHGEDDARSAMVERLGAAGLAIDRISCPELDSVVDLAGPREAPRAPPAPPAVPHPRLPKEAMGREDWHNDYAQLAIDIHDALDRLADERARNALLRRLRRALSER